MRRYGYKYSNRITGNSIINNKIMANEKQEPKKVVVLQIEDFKLVEAYIRQAPVSFDMVELAAKVKQIIQAAQIADFMPKDKNSKEGKE